jgi:hypothetical protein
LRFADLGCDLGATSDDIQGGPGEQGCDRVEIGGVGLATDAGGLEGYGAAAAEGIADPGSASEAFLAELGHEFAELGCGGAEVGVDLFPGFRRGAGDLLGAVAEGDLFVVGKAGEDGEFKLAEGGGEFFFALASVGGRGGAFPGGFEVGVGLELGVSGLLEDALLGFDPFEAGAEAFVIHRHDGEEAGTVSLRVIGGGHEEPDDGGSAEDEGLAAPPLAETGESLGVVGFSFLVGLLGNAGDGELGLDEGTHEWLSATF